MVDQQRSPAAAADGETNGITHQRPGRTTKHGAAPPFEQHPGGIRLGDSTTDPAPVIDETLYGTDSAQGSLMREIYRRHQLSATPDSMAVTTTTPHTRPPQ